MDQDTCLVCLLQGFVSEDSNSLGMEICCDTPEFLFPGEQGYWYMNRETIRVTLGNMFHSGAYTPVHQPEVVECP